MSESSLGLTGDALDGVAGTAGETSHEADIDAGFDSNDADEDLAVAGGDVEEPVEDSHQADIDATHDDDAGVADGTPE